MDFVSYHSVLGCVAAAFLALHRQGESGRRKIHDCSSPARNGIDSREQGFGSSQRLARRASCDLIYERQDLQ